MRGAKPRAPRRPDWVDLVVGRNVRIWRIVKGMSQSQLANSLGVTFQQVQKYETGSNRISTGRLVKLSRILEIPLSALFRGADEGNEALATPWAVRRPPGVPTGVRLCDHPGEPKGTVGAR